LQLRILCVHIGTSSLWVEFVNKNRCISVSFLSEIIHIIVSYDQNISLIFMWKMDPMSGCDRDSILQYKRCEHIWNNFPCIITLTERCVRDLSVEFSPEEISSDKQIALPGLKPSSSYTPPRTIASVVFIVICPLFVWRKI